MHHLFEILFNKRANYANFRVCGFVFYPCIRPYNDHKLMFKYFLYTFLGYIPCHRSCTFLLKDGILYLNHYVIFSKSQFPFASLCYHTPDNRHIALTKKILFTLPKASTNPFASHLEYHLTIGTVSIPLSSSIPLLNFP